MFVLMIPKKPEITAIAKLGNNREDLPSRRDECLVCGTSLTRSKMFDINRVCHVCNFHYSMTARERIESLVDPNSFREINRNITSLDPLAFSSRVSYKQRIFNDQKRTGLTEAIVTGTCSIGGSNAVLVVLDFGFMGGSMGSVVGEKVALSMEYAAKKKLPFISIVTSGGVRIQEGLLSLMQMAKTAITSNDFASTGFPSISVLANPATGHAYSSFANLADIILAEPGAIVGLAPIRDINDFSDEPVPGEGHTSESHLLHGMVDDVVHRSDLRQKLATILDLFGPRYRLKSTRKAEVINRPEPQRHAWDSVLIARRPDRPGTLDYISRILLNFVEIHGDRVYGDDGAVVCGFGHLGGQTVVVVGQERGTGTGDASRHGGRMSPEGFRKAKRTVTLAEKFDLPLITLIDTPGPFPSLDAEERGLGNTIATLMARMGGLSVPSIAIIIGEGGSEGAIPLAIANRVLMLEYAIYSVISPEVGAGLLYQDTGEAGKMAQSLRLTARDCWELGIVDKVLQEPTEGAHNNPDEAAMQLRKAILQEMASLQSKSKRRLVTERLKRFRGMGNYGSRFKTAITREVNTLQSLMSNRVRNMAKKNKLDKG